VQEETAQLKLKHQELQQTLETERAAWLTDKKTLEDTLVDMSTVEKHLESDRTLRESTAHEQEERIKASLVLL
jgi:nucleoprotein TPR